jgi:hypothetical protein
MKIIIIFLLMLTMMCTLESFAQQDKSGKFGIGYSGNLSSYSNELGATVFLSDDFSIEPQIGFQSIDIEDNSATAWKLGLGLIYRLNNFVVTPYIGARVKDNMVSGGDETYSDLILSLVFGGEYFVSEWFSVSAEMKLNYVKTDEDFSPTYDIADAEIFESEQVLNIRIYFN